MAGSDKLGKIVLETAYTSSGVDNVTDDVKKYTNVVINNLQKLRDFVKSADQNQRVNLQFDLGMKELQALLQRRSELERIAASNQKAVAESAQSGSAIFNFAKSAGQVLNAIPLTRSLGQEVAGLVAAFEALAAVVGTTIAAGITLIAGVGIVIQKLAEMGERYNITLLSAKRISFMLYSDISKSQSELRLAVADAHRFGMTIENVLSYKERLARLSSVTEEINFPQFTETALKMSLATGRSGEEIAANIARVIGMLRSGSGSARSLVSLGLSGEQINEILKLAKSDNAYKRQEAIDLFISALTERFQKLKESDFITPGQQFVNQLSAARDIAGEKLAWITNTFYSIASYIPAAISYWFTSKETFEATQGAADIPSSRPEDTDIRDYAVGLAWQSGLLRKLDPSNKLRVGLSYDFNRLMDKQTISIISKEYNEMVSELEQAVYLEASHKSLLDSEKFLLLAQLRYAQMYAEAKRSGNGYLHEQITQEKVLFDMQADYFNKMSKPLDDVLNRGLFGLSERQISETYTRLNETADPRLYDNLVNIYEQSLNAQIIQGKLSYEEYLTKFRTLQIMREYKDVILENLRAQNELAKKAEEEKRAAAEWNSKMDDFWKGSSRVRTIREMAELRRLFDQAVMRGMDFNLARETYNERMFDILQRGGLLRFNKPQSTPLPGLFTYGTAEALREVNRIRTFGTSRTGIDEMVRNIRDQLKLDARANVLLEHIKEVLIEMRDKIPGAGK